MVTEELILVKHALQDLLQSILADDGQQNTVALSSLSDTGHVSLCQIASILDEPVDSLLERRKFVDQLWFQSDGRIQRDQTHKRSHRKLLNPGAAPRNGIIVEAVFLVPKRFLILVTGSEGHCITNENKVLKELRCNIFVDTTVLGQFESNVEHGKTVESHPSRAVCLLQNTSSWERLGTVEQADVVETQEASLESVLALGILAVDPPGEVKKQLLENALQEVYVLATIHLALNLECSECGPGMNWGVHVSEVPLISANTLIIGI